MALEKCIAASIAYASTKSIGDRAYGSMLLTLDDSEEVVRTAIDFLTQTPDVAAQEVDFHV